MKGVGKDSQDTDSVGRDWRTQIVLTGLEASQDTDSVGRDWRIWKVLVRTVGHR
jgi:hypothetical protein